jgi:hypothetical protein
MATKTPQKAAVENAEVNKPQPDDFRNWVNLLHHHGLLSDADAVNVKAKIDTWATQQ